MPQGMPIEQLMHLAVTVTPRGAPQRDADKLPPLVEQLLVHRGRRWSAHAQALGLQPITMRLRALVDHAHAMGYWVRFYALDGFAPAEDQGWGNAYNFGSHEAVVLRWKAAIAAGVNFIATINMNARHLI